MKTVLVDASSAILLHKAKLLGDIQAAFRVCVSASVYGELTRYQRPGARTIAQECQTRQITIVAPNATAEAHHLPESLHRGERDTLLCYIDGRADFVIIDDGRGAGVCRREAIPYVNALLCPRLLAMAGLLPPAAAHQAMTRISELGRYSADIRHYATTCSTASLNAFLP